MNILAIIPARGGSRRIPRKNIKKFRGKPIISYSIEAAIKSGLFEEVMVSTDDSEIANVSRHYGANIPFMRSAENADDYAHLSDVCIEVVNMYLKQGKNFDALCCILSTAPFINAKTLICAKRLFDTKKYDCVLTVTEYSYPIQKALKIENDFIGMVQPDNFLKRSQDFEKAYHDAGQFYFINTKTMLSEKKLFVERTGAIILDNLEAQDIDTDTDWRLAEIKHEIVSKRKKQKHYEEL